MLRPVRPSYSLILTFFLLFFGVVEALPAESNLVRRQNGTVGGVQTVHTEHTTNTPAGLVTESCDITLTPTVASNGSSQVLEVQNCSVSVANNNVSGSSSSVDTSATSSTTSSTSISSTTVVASTSSSTSSITTTSPAAVSNAGSDPALSVNGVSTVLVSSTASAAAASSTAAAVAVSQNSPSSTTASSTTNAPTAAAENASASASSTPFTLPGKKLQVLPIGLGVFAGISVIALIVVGLVTYERTKYRKAFRQRKLAEGGAEMGYGGMAQRT